MYDAIPDMLRRKADFKAFVRIEVPLIAITTKAQSILSEVGWVMADTLTAAMFLSSRTRISLSILTAWPVADQALSQTTPHLYQQACHNRYPKKDADGVINSLNRGMGQNPHPNSRLIIQPECRLKCFVLSP